MAIYDINGNSLNDVYDSAGAALLDVYDVNGIPLPFIPDIPVDPMTWNMSDNYKAQVLDVLDTIKTYKQNNPNTLALCQFNDVHTQFSGNEPNFIDYNKGYKVIDYMMFLGDIVNKSDATQYQNAVTYMSGASASKKLVAMGNHEYNAYNSSYGDPEALYKAVINVDGTYMTNDALIYYHDDPAGVRLIALDYFHITKNYYDSGHLLDMAQLNWLAGALEGAGDKDVIIYAHSMLNPFTGLESGQTLNSSATLQNYQDLIDLIVAFKARSTYTVTVDNVEYEHDFSGCTGNFIMYTSGHYHALGYGDFGFNMFTGPTLYTTYGGSHKGFLFYVINRQTKAITVYQCSSELNSYISFSYSY